MMDENDKLTVERARQIMRADYYSDVADVAKKFAEKWKAGEFDSRDSAMEWIEQTIDGHSRVIYTRQAQEGVLASDNDDAYLDDFGEDGLVENGQIDWSKLMWAAMRRDVIEKLNADGIDVNDDPPDGSETEEATEE